MRTIEQQEETARLLDYYAGIVRSLPDMESCPGQIKEICEIAMQDYGDYCERWHGKPKPGNSESNVNPDYSI